MSSIKNVQPLTAESLFDLLKKELSDYINAALDANLSIDFAHVADVINISFPEIIEGNVFTLIVSDEEIEIVNHASEADYNTALLEQHLTEFLAQKVG